MKSDFKTAIKTIRTCNSKMRVESVNGCCYGRDNKPDKGDYFKYCGQRFWEFVSGNDDLYLEIIEPLGHKAKMKNDEFTDSYSKMINKFTKEFTKDFCDDDGAIDWNKLVRLNSAAKGDGSLVVNRLFRKRVILPLIPASRVIVEPIDLFCQTL